MAYYLIEEDPDSEFQISLGTVPLGREERKAMLLGEMKFIPGEPLPIPLAYPPGENMSDFMNHKYPIISPRFKDLLEEAATDRLFYREIYLEDDTYQYPYYYLAAPKYDCIDYKNSSCIKDERMPGGIRIKKGFYIRNAAVPKADIFRAQGLSNRRLIISERLKKLMEANNLKGIQYIETTKVSDMEETIEGLGGTQNESIKFGVYRL